MLPRTATAHHTHINTAKVSTAPIARRRVCLLSTSIFMFAFVTKQKPWLLTSFQGQGLNFCGSGNCRGHVMGHADCMWHVTCDGTRHRDRVEFDFLPSGLYRRPRLRTGSCLAARGLGFLIALPPIGNFTLP